MGANPLKVMTSSVWGGLTGIGGITLTLVGRWWITRLISHAQDKSEEQPETLLGGQHP